MAAYEVRGLITTVFLRARARYNNVLTRLGTAVNPVELAQRTVKHA